MYALAFAYLAGTWRMSVLARRQYRDASPYARNAAEAMRVIGLVLAWPLLAATVLALFGIVGVVRLFRDAEVS